MPDYSKSKVYLLRNTVNDLVYVGSTVASSSERKATHKYDPREWQLTSMITKCKDVKARNFTKPSQI